MGVLAAKEYTFTVSNSGGAVTCKKMMHVTAAAPKCLYYQARYVASGIEAPCPGSETFVFTLGSKVNEYAYVNKASMAGGASLKFDMTGCTLPKGLSFSSSTGDITGVPTELSDK